MDLNKQLGVTSVVVTHEMDSAFRIADRMVLLDRGKFIVSGTPDEMRNNTDPLVRQFVHGLTEGPLTDRRRAGGTRWICWGVTSEECYWSLVTGHSWRLPVGEARATRRSASADAFRVCGRTRPLKRTLRSGCFPKPTFATRMPHE